jgi:hypothetical protein
MMFKRAPLAVALILITWLGWACAEVPSPNSGSEFGGQFQVDPIFRAFYNYHGGEDRLGNAISAQRKEGDATIQFLETCKLVFDPNAPANSRFRLAPLGVEMGVREPDAPQPSNPDLNYLNGHTISPEFYPLYKEMGAEIVGLPLTDEKFNMIRKRHEQYFENLGFYRIEGTSEVHLLAYGIWVCGEKCSTNTPPSQAGIDILSYIDPVFEAFINQNGIDLTGFALSAAYTSPDGKWEQIFENVVLAADSRINSQSVSLRPISEKVHITVEKPRSPINGSQMYFYPVQDGEGYEIPLYFWDFIQKHGGVQVSGLPITHYVPLMDHVYHQCFTNLCLVYDKTRYESARVRPEPLGYPYRVLYRKAPEPKNAPQNVSSMTLDLLPAEDSSNAQVEEAPIKPTPISFPTAIAADLQQSAASPTTETGAGEMHVVSDSQGEIDMQVWERYLVVGQQQGQEISIWVVEDDRSMVGVNADVTVRMPDGSKQKYAMPSTNVSGHASIMLPSIEAPNGTIVPFKVCIAATAGTRFCIADFFVIWETQ